MHKLYILIFWSLVRKSAFLEIILEGQTNMWIRIFLLQSQQLCISKLNTELLACYWFLRWSAIWTMHHKSINCCMIMHAPKDTAPPLYRLPTNQIIGHILVCQVHTTHAWIIAGDYVWTTNLDCFSFLSSMNRGKDITLICWQCLYIFMVKPPNSCYRTIVTKNWRTSRRLLIPSLSQFWRKILPVCSHGSSSRHTLLNKSRNKFGPV